MPCQKFCSKYETDNSIQFVARPFTLRSRLFTVVLLWLNILMLVKSWLKVH